MMSDIESYRLAILFLMFGWGFNMFALCVPHSTLVKVYVLGPMVLGTVLLLDSLTFDLLRGPAQTAWLWVFGGI